MATHDCITTPPLTRIAGGLGRVLTVDNLFTSELSERLNLNIYCIEPFQQIEVGPYQVLSVAANHAPETTAMLYLIERDGRTLFYGTDTGEMPQATWDALEAHGWPCDVVVLDHTFGMKGRSNGHMNHEQFMEQVDKFRSLGLLAADARIYATHLAHHSNPTHEELTTFAAERGYIPAYDGLVVEV
jgi:phosphoribosyl 1,2-cyclic phosphate phosphodiesterase